MCFRNADLEQRANFDLNSKPTTIVPGAGIAWLRRLLVFISVPPLLASVASFFGQHFFLSELLVNYQFQLAVILFVIALLSFGSGIRRWATVLVFASIGVCIPLALALAPAENPTAGSRTIKLMSFNVYVDNVTKAEAVECIKQHDPDIVLVVEYANTWKNHVSDLFEAYPFRVDELRWHGFGIILLSKFELSDTQVFQSTSEASDVPVIVATVNAGGQHMKFFGVHLLAPMDPMRMEIRNRQLVEVADLVGDSSSQPTILAGDFNCVAWSSYMQQMLKRTGLRDSRRGIGYHASWPTDAIHMRIPIDHVFVSDQIHVKSRRLLGQTGSDHFPVLMEFSINQAAGAKHDQPETQ